MRHALIFCAVVTAFTACLTAPSVAQEKEKAAAPGNPFEPGSGDAPQTDDAKPRLKLDLGAGQSLGGGIGGIGGSEEANFSAGFKVDKAGGKGNLYVKADVAPGWHIYSLTQPPGGGQPLKLTPKKGKEFT